MWSNIYAQPFPRDRVTSVYLLRVCPTFVGNNPPDVHVHLTPDKYTPNEIRQMSVD